MPFAIASSFGCLEHPIESAMNKVARTIAIIVRRLLLIDAPSISVPVSCHASQRVIKFAGSSLASQRFTLGRRDNFSTVTFCESRLDRDPGNGERSRIWPDLICAL